MDILKFKRDQYDANNNNTPDTEDKIMGSRTELTE